MLDQGSETGTYCGTAPDGRSVAWYQSIVHRNGGQRHEAARSGSAGPHKALAVAMRLSPHRVRRVGKRSARLAGHDWYARPTTGAARWQVASCDASLRLASAGGGASC
ncbi:hypothetical protein L1887_48880 [Cichorium endivia]|nr:hypothetical protein L1887_48880 [Cichorium endivia]